VNADAVLESREVERSFLTRVVFPCVAWGLAFHSLVLAALFGWLGLPQGAVRAIAAWKDVALVLLLFTVFIRAVSGRGARITLTWADLWVGGMVAVGFIYLAGENLWLRANLPIVAELLGIRQSVLFFLIYFVGRSMPELADDPKTVRNILILVVVTCILGIAERFLVPPEGLVALGVASYFQDFLDAAAVTVGNEYGLPTNYWIGIGGRLVRRAGSVYLGGQGFAIPFLLFFPLATAWALPHAKRTGWRVAIYLLICFSLLLTLTRMTIIVAAIQLTLFILIRRRPEWTVAGLALAGMVFLAAFVLVPGVPTFVLDTLSGQEASTRGHISDFSNGALTFFQQPWGLGLGTADAAAVRTGLEHITGDNLYLTYAVEMGLAGLLFLVGSLGSILGHAFDLLRHGRTDSQRLMGITLWLATLGLIMNGMTSVVFNSITLAWIYFWLAGAVVTNSQRLRSTEALAGKLELTPVA
jgi:hypothetical protein